MSIFNRKGAASSVTKETSSPKNESKGVFGSIKDSVKGGLEMAGANMPSKKHQLKADREGQILELRRQVDKLSEAVTNLGGNAHAVVALDERNQQLYKKHSSIVSERRLKHSKVPAGIRQEIRQAVHNEATMNSIESLGKHAFHDKTGDTIAALEVNWDWTKEPAAEFGADMKEKHFMLDPNRVFLNGASYGATPKSVIGARRAWEDLFQQDPVLFRFKSLPFRLGQCLHMLCENISCDSNDCVLFLNANAATSTVLKAIPWRSGDVMLILSVDYDATKLACEHLEETYGVETVEVKLTLPMSDDDVIAAVEKSLQEFKEPPMLANFCHVTSKTAWKFPAKRLVNLFHKYGVSVMVDGAQAVGQHSIDIGGLAADYYIGTVHKWMYSCQGVAFLVTAPHKQSALHPLTVSYFKGKGYEKEFSYTGLQDFTPWLATIQAFEFVQKVCGGWFKVRTYCHQLANDAVALLEGMWGTKCIQDEAHRGAMPIVPLPKGENVDKGSAATVMGYLLTHNITAFLLVEEFGGAPTLCVRLTCQIYNCLDDYKKLGEVVNSLNGSYGALNVGGNLFANMAKSCFA